MRSKLEKSLSKLKKYVNLAAEGNIGDKPYVLTDLLKMLNDLLRYVTLPCLEVSKVAETYKRVFALTYGNTYFVTNTSSN